MREGSGEEVGDSIWESVCVVEGQGEEVREVETVSVWLYDPSKERVLITVGETERDRLPVPLGVDVGDWEIEGLLVCAGVRLVETVTVVLGDPDSLVSAVREMKGE